MVARETSRRLHRHQKRGSGILPARSDDKDVVRISITREAYDAIYVTLLLGSVAVEPEADERGERLIWLEDAMADRLGAMRGPGDSYSDVILRLWAPNERG